MLILNYETAIPDNAILVTASGPSIQKCFSDIQKISNEVTVISANRNITEKTNYTVFIDNKQYQRESQKISNIIIVGPKIRTKNNKHLFLDYKFKINKVSKISISPNGAINHMCCGAGFAAALCAVFFKPKKIYLAGFDGLIKNKLEHFGLSKSKVFSNFKTKQAKRFFSLTLSYFAKKGIKIYAWKQDSFWGINKTAYGIKTY